MVNNFIIIILMAVPFIYFCVSITRYEKKGHKIKSFLMLLFFYFYFLSRLAMYFMNSWGLSSSFNTVGVVFGIILILFSIFQPSNDIPKPIIRNIWCIVLLLFCLSFYKFSSVEGLTIVLKNNVLPVLFFFVGINFAPTRAFWFKRFLGLYLFSGGIYTFLYQSGFQTLFDITWFGQIGLPSASNWWQGDVVRFWGMFTNFEEWYGLCALILIYLFGSLKTDPSRQSWWIFTLGLLGYLFMNLIGPERSSIAVVVVGILIITAFSKPDRVKLYNKRKQYSKILLFCLSVILTITGLSFVYLNPPIMNDDSAYARLYEMTNPFSAETMQIREQNQWTATYELIKLYPGGVGAENLEVTSSHKPMVATHSFYLHAILAYSVYLAIPLFALFVLLMVLLMGTAIMEKDKIQLALITELAIFLPQLGLAALNPVMINNWGKFTWMFLGLSLSLTTYRVKTSLNTVSNKKLSKGSGPTKEVDPLL